MTNASTFRTVLSRTWLPALALIVMAFFGGYAVLGSNGVLAYGEYKRQLVVRQAQYAKLDRERAILKNRVNLLDPKHANPDMVDELVRKQLNVANPDEVIIPLH